MAENVILDLKKKKKNWRKNSKKWRKKNRQLSINSVAKIYLDQKKMDLDRFFSEIWILGLKIQIDLEVCVWFSSSQIQKKKTTGDDETIFVTMLFVGCSYVCVRMSGYDYITLQQS